MAPTMTSAAIAAAPNCHGLNTFEREAAIGGVAAGSRSNRKVWAGGAAGAGSTRLATTVRSTVPAPGGGSFAFGGSS